MSRGSAEIRKLTSVLLSASFLASVLSVVYLVVIARALSLSDLGKYASVVALIIVSEKLFGFQTWNAVIHFGARFREQNSSSRWRKIQILGGVVDFSGSFAAAVFAVMVLYFVPPTVIDFGHDPLTIVAVVLPILTFGYPTALGILKHSRMLRIEAGATIATPLVTLVGFIILAQREEPTVGAFVMAWAIGLVVPRIMVVIAGLVQFRKRLNALGGNRSNSSPLETRASVLRFLFFAKIDAIVLAVRDADVVLVSWILGPDSAGLYKVARQVSSVVGFISTPLEQAFAPVLAKMSARSRNIEARQLAFKSAGVTGIGLLPPVLLFLLLGEQVLKVVFGEIFGDAYSSAALALLAMVIMAVGRPITPLLLSWGESRSLATVGVASVLLYFVLLAVLASGFGLEGAATSLVVYHSVQLVLLLVTAVRSSRRR